MTRIEVPTDPRTCTATCRPTIGPACENIEECVGNFDAAIGTVGADERARVHALNIDITSRYLRRLTGPNAAASTLPETIPTIPVPEASTRRGRSGQEQSRDVQRRGRNGRGSL